MVMYRYAYKKMRWNDQQSETGRMFKKYNNIYAKRSEAENFFEKFIARDLKIAPKK